MENNTLRHWGVKGMKWGVRRYQNKDGTLTDAGKKRYDRDIRENNAKKKDNRIVIDGPDADRWVKEDIRRAKNLADDGSRTVNELTKINNASKKKNRTRMNLDHMTDKEMRDKINRELLERQYNDVFNPERTSRGREYVNKVLETAGTVLTVGGSVLTIALGIRELMGPKE